MPQPDSISSTTTFVTSESRREYQLRCGLATPRFLQGVYPFVGRDIFGSIPLHADLTYTTPAGASAELAYVRAGNSSDDLIYLVILANDVPLRYFPLGPKADTHVGLAIVEKHPAGTLITVHVSAPRGVTGAVILDIGIMELHEGSNA